VLLVWVMLILVKMEWTDILWKERDDGECSRLIYPIPI
jgi:hypothetical protein